MFSFLYRFSSRREALFRQLRNSLGKASALSVAFVAGIVAGGSGAYLYLDRAAEAEREEAAQDQAAEMRHICGLHQAALCQRAELYHEQLGRWPTNVEELVATRFLPEYSQVHLCSLQIPASGLITSYDQQWTFIERTQHGTLGYFVLSPYRFGVAGTNFGVRCSLAGSHNE